jgi:hypothetical protein
MKTAKIGRNDPCPCGSGKKYKNCCLVLEDIVDRNISPFERYSQLITSLKVKLEQYYDRQIRKLRKPLQEQFMRLAANPSLPREQEALLSDWLWFDMIDSEGMSFGGEYLHDNGSYMDESLRDCLRALNSSYLSMYEAVGMEADCLRVQDFLSGEETLVLLKEPLEMEISDNRPLLLGRLVMLPLGQVFSGIVLMLKNDDGQSDFVRRHIDYWRRLSGDIELPALLKRHAEILFGLFDRANHKSLLPLNDIRVLRVPEKIARLTVEIEKSPAWRLAHETAEIRWYDLLDSQGNVRIGVQKDYVVSYADVLDDILRVEDNWSELVAPGEWEIVNSRLLFQPPTAELEQIWYSVIKEQETERWLQTPHRELDDKTPREVMAETQGRERIQATLDDFASQTSGNEHSQDLLSYMRLRIQTSFTAPPRADKV